MCAYVYTNTGRGLRVYKKHWRDIENEQRPGYMYVSFKDAACFFMGLKKVKGKDTIKLPGTIIKKQKMLQRNLIKEMVQTSM